MFCARLNQIDVNRNYRLPTDEEWDRARERYPNAWGESGMGELRQDSAWSGNGSFRVALSE